MMSISENYKKLNAEDKKTLQKLFIETFNVSVRHFYYVINRQITLSEPQVIFFAERFGIDLNILKNEKIDLPKTARPLIIRTRGKKRDSKGSN